MFDDRNNCVWRSGLIDRGCQQIPARLLRDSFYPKPIADHDLAGQIARAAKAALMGLALEALPNLFGCAPVRLAGSSWC
jgi:hypothetical protein